MPARRVTQGTDVVFGVDSPAWRPVRLPRRRRVARAPLPASRDRGVRPRAPGRREQVRRKPARKRSARKRGAAGARRPAPRAVRNGPGPVARVFTALARVLATAWLGVAHAVGGGVRRVGHTARELDPEHRRDGAGLFLVGLALVVAAAVWWQLPGGIGEFTRTVVAGSVGLLAWFVPLLLCFVAWRNLRDPERNGPRRPPGDRLGRAALRRARHRAHRQRLADPRAGRHRAPPAGGRRDRLRGLQAAAGPAADRPTSWCRCCSCSRCSGCSW